MSVIDTLITDRTAADVQRLKQLMSITWRNMTPEEQGEYLNGGSAPLYDSNYQQLFDSENEPLYSADAGGSQKGAYNYTDWNRVETAVSYMAGVLVQADTDVRQYAADLGVAWDSSFEVPYDPNDFTNVSVKTDWDEDDFPSVSEMNRYLSNVRNIRDALQDDSPLPDSMRFINYEGANQIERALINANQAAHDMVETIEGMIRSTLAVNYSGEIYSGEGYA